MLPAAVLAIAILLLAARSRRWQLCRLAPLVGLVAIVVAIVVDRPAGLDEGTLPATSSASRRSCSEASGRSSFAGAGLLVTSLLLGAELRRAGPVSRRRRDPGRRRTAPARKRRDGRLPRARGGAPRRRGAGRPALRGRAREAGSPARRSCSRS